MRARSIKGVANKSELEESLALAIRALHLPTPAREYKFHRQRRWRFDFAWPEQMIAVECEGGAWNGGRHTRGKGFIDDCVKYNEATRMGWSVYRFPADLIKNGDAIELIEGLFKTCD